MFGFVVANLDVLTEAQRRRYRSVYCGLCRTLQSRHGSLCRLTLNYDMSFLVLLLSSMYEPEEQTGSVRCAVHPVHRRDWSRNRFTDYAADMNVALAYHNCMDDWTDDRSLLSLGEARALRARYREISARWPRQTEAMERCMIALRAVETAEAPSPDAAANCFGELMGELFAPENDPVWQPHFRAFGAALGRFICFMDACVDLERDKRRGSFNPLLVLHPEGMDEEEKLSLLKLHIGECTAEFELLPLVQDVEILRSVLYSGVWTQYAVKMKKRGVRGE